MATARIEPVERAFHRCNSRPLARQGRFARWPVSPQRRHTCQARARTGLHPCAIASRHRGRRGRGVGAALAPTTREDDAPGALGYRHETRGETSGFACCLMHWSRRAITKRHENGGGLMSSPYRRREGPRRVVRLSPSRLERTANSSQISAHGCNRLDVDRNRMRRRTSPGHLLQATWFVSKTGARAPSSLTLRRDRHIVNAGIGPSSTTDTTLAPASRRLALVGWRRACHRHSRTI